MMINYKQTKIFFSETMSRDFIIKELDGVNTVFPLDESSSDYQEYLAWLAEGNEPEVING